MNNECYPLLCIQRKAVIFFLICSNLFCLPDGTSRLQLHMEGKGSRKHDRQSPGAQTALLTLVRPLHSQKQHGLSSRLCGHANFGI